MVAPPFHSAVVLARPRALSERDSSSGLRSCVGEPGSVRDHLPEDARCPCAALKASAGRSLHSGAVFCTEYCPRELEYQYVEEKDSTVPDTALNESSDERSSSLLDNIFESPQRSFKAAFGDSCNKTPKSYSHFRGIHCLPTPESRSCRNSPLPQFFWADQENVWGLMNHKDVIYTHSATALERHPALQPRMRTILLDWLIEVCEVYRLQRDTYYLAQDFVDRYLTKSENLPKNQLQLVGITALFLAAKMEEIYPPKLSEFAYVTDGACQESEILEKELAILTALNWDLTPMTVNGWLNTYLQIIARKESRDREGQNFLVPEFSTCSFIKVAQLADLCMLDVECLQFTYSFIAASAIHHMLSPSLASDISGYKTVELGRCIEWMAPFATVIKRATKDRIPVAVKGNHEIQVHHVNLQLVEEALCLKRESSASGATSRGAASSSVAGLGVLTPPPPL
ncbi:hypothetical protein HPB47_011290 [Ixodes persulcatus]|uniref:Uncharacterized protein n=1 Tax=Ixodes persulcatus TaxID=34615 RepID=A0AC60NWU1_IXOPE|nr:hypothetical protein HPB47_011290 [Ixodes persulcatus]